MFWNGWKELPSEVLVITARCWGGEVSELITRYGLLPWKTWISNLAFVFIKISPSTNHQTAKTVLPVCFINTIANPVLQLLCSVYAILKTVGLCIHVQDGRWVKPVKLFCFFQHLAPWALFYKRASWNPVLSVLEHKNLSWSSSMNW